MNAMRRGASLLVALLVSAGLGAVFFFLLGIRAITPIRFCHSVLGTASAICHGHAFSLAKRIRFLGRSPTGSRRMPGWIPPALLTIKYSAPASVTFQGAG